MSVKQFRKKPVVNTAMQWTGGNVFEMWEWVGADKFYGPLPVGDPLRSEGQLARLYVDANSTWLPLEIGEWVIRDSKGFYPCKPDIFEATYEAVE